MNKINKFLILGILLVLTLQNVVALGVTPGRNTLNYPDEVNETFSFKILNSENKHFNVDISVVGELGEYIKLSKEKHQFSENQDSIEVSYTLSIPTEGFSPGDHKGEIIISEESETVQSVGAKIGVVSEVVFFIPYPNKYIESALEVVEMENKTFFLIPVINKGEEKIDSLDAEIDIYVGDERVDTVSTRSIELESMERSELRVEWLPTFSLGSYQANVVLNYDGNENNFVEDFQIGEIDIEVFDLFITDFELGNIISLDILIENKWNEPLKEVYANLILNDSRGEVVNIKSAPYDVGARSKIRIPIYWETVGVKEGKYDGQIIINYKDFSSAKGIYVDISEYGIGVELESGEFVLKEEVSWTKTILIALVIFGIILFILFKKFKVANKK